MSRTIPLPESERLTWMVMSSGGMNPPTLGEPRARDSMTT